MASKKLADGAVPFNRSAQDPAPRPPMQLVHDAAHLAVEQAIHTAPAAHFEAATPPTSTPVTLPTAPDTLALAQASVPTAIVAVTRQKSAFAAMEKTMKSAEEFVSFGQGNLEAMMKSGQIWAAGFQDLSKSLAATAQAQLDHTVSSWKALAGVKSVKEAMDLQSSLARSSVETVVTETSKLTDASMKLAEQTMAPITARVSLAVEKFGRTA